MSDTSSQPVRFAILGFGHHAVRRLLPAFRRSQHAVLTGMWRRNPEAARQNCAELEIPHCFATAEELCASPEVDVVFITSPDAMHLEDALLAFRYGKAVLCEKPLTMHASEAERMVVAAESADLLLGVGQNFRYNHSLDWLKQQIMEGRIGQPQLAHAQYTYPARNAPRKWIRNLDLACGGPIADVGVHCVDSLRYLLGQDVISVETMARAEDPVSPVETTASLALAMTGRIFATVSVSAGAPYRTLLEVTGSDGVLIAENGLTVDRPVEMVLRRGGELIETHTADNSDGYVRMLDDFAQAYRGKTSFRATGTDGVHNMRVLDAAYQSWRTGKREPV